MTETIYRHQIRPVITIGAEAMDKIFANEQGFVGGMRGRAARQSIRAHG